MRNTVIWLSVEAIHKTKVYFIYIYTDINVSILDHNITFKIF